ncbi:MAG TPA: hypothetical protein VN688_21575 [Gemmataceae bacterium]|nr:hypothetical protein [Gemmataceae bacterium]
MRVAFLFFPCVAMCIAQIGCATPRYGKVLISAVQGSRAEKICLVKDPDHPPSGAATLAYWKSLKDAG